MKSNNDDDVGYGKPPKHAQFKPGQSGNRAGRPKGRRPLLDDLAAELSETVTITEAGRTRRMTKQRAVVKRATTKAISGDFRAFDFLVKRLPLLEEAEKAREQEQFWRRMETNQAIERSRKIMGKLKPMKKVEIDVDEDLSAGGKETS